jgi:hypothetical protein
MAITTALADPKRVRTLQDLREGELCVCQFSGHLAFAGVVPGLNVRKNAGWAGPKRALKKALDSPDQREYKRVHIPQ